MTLVEIEVLIHYAYKPCDIEERNYTPAVRNAIEAHCRRGLLRERETIRDNPALYEVTDKGRAYLEALQALPMPVQKWAMP